MVTVWQSAAPAHSPWIDRCLGSIREWARCQGFDYRFIGDELFDELTTVERDTLAGRLPIQADLARLRLLNRHLDTAGGIALWIDADSFCLDQTWLPDLSSPAGFGFECWVQADDRGRYRPFQTPHNAFMVFAAGNPVSPFLEYSATSIVRRVKPGNIAPQLIGPKLLKALHNIAHFDMYPEAGALSPSLAAELVSVPGKAVACYRDSGAPMPKMINLCSSLVGSSVSEDSVVYLLDHPDRFSWLGKQDPSVDGMAVTQSQLAEK